MTQETKTCQNCKSQFAIEPEDFAFYGRMQVPAPTFCPECRSKRRIVFYNQHTLFRKKEMDSDRVIFSGYPESSPIQIIDRDRWWKGDADGMKYGRDYDFSRPFFEQFKELMYAVPWPALSVRNLVRSEYCNQANDFKDCYLSFEGDHGENCLYGIGFYEMKDDVDFYMANNCELCYEVFSVSHSYKSLFITESDECRDSWFMLNCTNCSDCVGCVGLTNKQYRIWNEPHTKEEYFAKVKEMNLGSWTGLQAVKNKFDEFRFKFPAKYSHVESNVNSIGEYVYRSKNAKYCYQALDVDNGKYLLVVSAGVRDSMDYTCWGDNVEFMYETLVSGDQCRNLKFCAECWPSAENMEYSMNCHSSKNLFGCMGLIKQEYCIFNKQYTKEEYEKLTAKIRAHMNEMPFTDKLGNEYRYGEFFPPEFSPLAYNDSSAQDYYPLKKEEALAAGFTWRDIEAKEFKTTFAAKDIPDHINNVTEDILKEVIGCERCGRAYRVIAPELAFYKRLGIPVPHTCPQCRFEERIKYRNPIKWHTRSCQCAGALSDGGVYKNTENHPLHTKDQHCPETFETTYPPGGKDILYCDSCYKNEFA